MINMIVRWEGILYNEVSLKMESVQNEKENLIPDPRNGHGTCACPVQRNRAVGAGNGNELHEMKKRYDIRHGQ